MQHDDREMRAMLAPFDVHVPTHLAQRIIANATAMPQSRGLFGFVSQAMSQWNYALAYKGMALACFMLLGILSAQTQTNTLSAPSSLDMSPLVMAQDWMEE